MKFLVNLVASNQLLSAGIGTVLFGSLMYFVRGVPIWAWQVARRMLTIEVFMTSESFLYHDMLAVLGAHRVSFLARNYTTAADGRLAPGYGQSVAVFRGRLVWFQRALMDNRMRLDEQLEVTIFSRSTALLSELVAEARRQVEPGYVQVFMSETGGYWASAVKRRARDLDTVFANAATKDDIAGRITWFLANEDWYRQRGITYKLVFLLHGEPGTGKTSLIHGMASAFGMSLCAVSGSIAGIDHLLRSVPGDSFVVIEDIDALTVDRDDGSDDVDLVGKAVAGPPVRPAASAAARSALQVLINTLDGLGTPHGLILFITTNHLDHLDRALVRPGRVDCEVLVERLDRASTVAMFMAFYGKQYRALVERHVHTLDFEPRTGADLQILFMTHGPESAAAALAARSHPPASNLQVVT